jgi:hypothetical protein
VIESSRVTEALGLALSVACTEKYEVPVVFFGVPVIFPVAGVSLRPFGSADERGTRADEDGERGDHHRAETRLHAATPQVAPHRT